MLDAIKPLLDSDLLNEDAKQEISEAWEAKLTEAREQIRSELREEFAQRYEHDKSVMVEALDRMVTEGITAEVQAIAEEKRALAEDRVRFQTKMKENAQKFDSFMVSKLAEELGELRKDRRQHNEAIQKLEKFVVKALAEEIMDFAQDKRALAEARVRLVTEARQKLESLKARFIRESAERMGQAVTKHLRNELTQLREDIQEARENNFGRRIFEAYAAEFANTHLNENDVIRKLRRHVEAQNQQLSESAKILAEAKAVVKSKEHEIKMIRETNERSAVMEELLTPLNEEKRQVMRDLLESVQTNRLKNAYEKYLPAVLADRSPKAKTVISESVREVTGDKKTVPAVQGEEGSNVIELKRLAGL